MRELIRDNKQSEYIRLTQEDPSLVQVTRHDGRTTFHLAAIYGRLQVMEAINNIDPHMKDRVDKYNQTHLMFASMEGHVACVKWLLDHDADVNIKDYRGQTVLDMPSDQDIKKMIKKK